MGLSPLPKQVAGTFCKFGQFQHKRNQNKNFISKNSLIRIRLKRFLEAVSLRRVRDATTSVVSIKVMLNMGKLNLPKSSDYLPSTFQISSRSSSDLVSDASPKTFTLGGTDALSVDSLHGSLCSWQLVLLRTLGQCLRYTSKSITLLIGSKSVATET